jgi:hypothetical protein
MKATRAIAVFAILTSMFGVGCKKKEESHYKYPMNWCQATKIDAQSIKSSCNIQFWDIMHQYTYVSIESSFYFLGPPCSQSAFEIKYINSKHDHNEPDYSFVFKISELDIYERQSNAGGGGPMGNVDITLIWDEVTLSGSVYSGKGKFIINKDIPSSFPGYKYPAQEIPFEFQTRDRETE